jgi:hypothetical protein
MTVVAFKPPASDCSGTWHADELQQLVGIFAAHAARGDVSDWAVAATEAGDPQFYVLGASPAHDCVLAISRLGRDYVLEDGEGAVIAENHNLALIAEKAIALSLSGRRTSMLASVGVLWIALRHQYEEKIEPLFAEPMEVVTHFFPQVAAFV